ncbi:hypothetical protein [Streptomyces sp. NBC_01296]|nr:hypothetical protein OG299_25100 [Streptomyces sp. NBC_01296]
METEVGGFGLDRVHEFLHGEREGTGLDGLIGGGRVHVRPEHDFHA